MRGGAYVLKTTFVVLSKLVQKTINNYSKHASGLDCSYNRYVPIAYACRSESTEYFVSVDGLTISIFFVARVLASD